MTKVSSLHTTSPPSTQVSITIRLDPAQIGEIADAVAARLGQATPNVTSTVTYSNPPVSEPQTAWSGDTSPQQGVSPQQTVVSQQPSDPWGAQTPSGGIIHAPSGSSAPVQPSASAPTTSPSNGFATGGTVQAPPMCRHGQMRRVPGGIAQTGPRAGQPYPPFYACPADRNDPTKCKSVPAQ